MELDAYIAAHRDQWDRLEQLLARRRRLTGAEIDELVELYHRVSTHLSVVRSHAPDEIVVGRLSTLVARARSVVTGAHDPAWKDVASFFTVSFPAAVYTSARWWAPTAIVFLAVSLAIGWWVVANPGVHADLVPPEQVRQLVEEDFANYYDSDPASEFALRVWLNNAWIAAQSLVVGVAFGLPVVFVLWQNALNVGVTGGFMVVYERADVFFGLVTPHGLLELTAVFIAAGAGLRLGWTVVDPGPRTRVRALAETGRATVGMALGLAVVLAISGLIEAFVTPSPLPTWARIAVGVLAEIAFLGYVAVLGRRAVEAGERGDVGRADREDVVPAAG